MIYVYGVDIGPPGHHIAVDEALHVIKGKHHLIGPAGLGLALDGPRGPVLTHCLDCSFVHHKMQGSIQESWARERDEGQGGWRENEEEKINHH